jgi:acyl-CoA synthetase (AMP-forming)/AMP-acid ligase II
MLLGNGLPFSIVLFAALRLGAVAVPISTREQTQGLAYMLRHCGANLLAFDPDLAERLPATTQTPDLMHRIAVERGVPSAAMRLIEHASGAAPTAVEEEDIAMLLYTSGHHRAAEGSNADPPRHLPLRHALRMLHGTDSSRSRPRGRPDEPCDGRHCADCCNGTGGGDIN